MKKIYVQLMKQYYVKKKKKRAPFILYCYGNIIIKLRYRVKTTF